jgi:hypothetical protein
MLGPLKMDVDACIRQYLEMAPKIFPKENFLAGSKVGHIVQGAMGKARFDGNNLERVVQELVQERLGNPNAPLYREESEESQGLECRT